MQSLEVPVAELCHSSDPCSPLSQHAVHQFQVHDRLMLQSLQCQSCDTPVVFVSLKYHMSSTNESAFVMWHSSGVCRYHPCVCDGHLKQQGLFAIFRPIVQVLVWWMAWCCHPCLQGSGKPLYVSGRLCWYWSAVCDTVK